MHLERLVEMEYVVAHRGRGRGSTFLYELAWFADTTTKASWRGDDGVLSGGRPANLERKNGEENQGLRDDAVELAGGSGEARYRRRVNGTTYAKGPVKTAASVEA